MIGPLVWGAEPHLFGFGFGFVLELWRWDGAKKGDPATGTLDLARLVLGSGRQCGALAANSVWLGSADATLSVEGRSWAEDGHRLTTMMFRVGGLSGLSLGPLM